MNSRDTGQPPACATPATGRRRDIRLAVPAELQCVLCGKPTLVTLSNISCGGFGARVNMPLGRNTVYEFAFTFGELHVVCRARVVHCAWIDGNEWHIGAEFQPDDDKPSIDPLIDRVTGTALDFD